MSVYKFILSLFLDGYKDYRDSMEFGDKECQILNSTHCNNFNMLLFFINKQLKMFNTFQAEKCIQNKKNHDRQERRLSMWFKKYKDQIRPSLVEKYHRRVNGFAKKMEDEPFILNQEEKPTFAKLFRASDIKLNISNNSFKFKDVQDWKSLFSPAQRAQRQDRLKSLSKDKDQHLALRSIESQSKYCGKKVSYRERDRFKQINPPMKYSNKNSKAMFEALPMIQNKKRQGKRYKTQGSKKGQANLSRQSVDSENKQSEMGNLSDMDLQSMYNSSFLRKRDPRKTQLQIIQQQQLKALAQSKLYFKSLIELEQQVKTKKQKQEMKQILKKCRVVKDLKTGNDKKQDIFDNIIAMMRN